ncbi:MAG: hypothetical protein JWP97_6685 [Labilithrix sp.]|nr:hypothetical protein [Labilithrix sp.]
MTTPEPAKPPTHPAVLALTRFAWPLAMVAVAGIGYAALHETLRDLRPAPASEVTIAHPTPTVLKDLRELSRLETLSLHLEKVVDVKDEQRRMYGLVGAQDSLLFVATGEVVLGVDFGRLKDGDVRFDETTHTAYVTLPPVEILSSRFDEGHSYVHVRSTDLLAKRNEALESLARRDALKAFEATAREPSSIARARAQAERQIAVFAKGWGAKDVVVTWGGGAPAGEVATEQD